MLVAHKSHTLTTNYNETPAKTLTLAELYLNKTEKTQKAIHGMSGPPAPFHHQPGWKYKVIFSKPMQSVFIPKAPAVHTNTHRLTHTPVLTCADTIGQQIP